MLKIKHIYATVIIIIIMISKLSAGYIQFGPAFSKSSDYSGYSSNIEFGIWSFDKIFFGFALDTTLLGKGGVNELLNDYKELSQINDITNLTDDMIDKVVKYKLSTKGFLIVNYDYGKPRGLYFFGGLGYGINTYFRDSAKSIAKFANMYNTYDPNSVDASDFEVVVNDLGSYIEDLHNLLDAVNAGSLFSQVDSVEKINALANDKGALETFTNDLESALNDANTDFSDSKVICAAVLVCEQAIAYKLGVGYDLKLIKALGLNFHSNVSGLLGDNSPIISYGANIIFKW